MSRPRHPVHPGRGRGSGKPVLIGDKVKLLSKYDPTVDGYYVPQVSEVVELKRVGDEIWIGVRHPGAQLASCVIYTQEHLDEAFGHRVRKRSA